MAADLARRGVVDRSRALPWRREGPGELAGDGGRAGRRDSRIDPLSSGAGGSTTDWPGSSAANWAIAAALATGLTAGAACVVRSTKVTGGTPSRAAALAAMGGGGRALANIGTGKGAGTGALGCPAPIAVAGADGAIAWPLTTVRRGAAMGPSHTVAGECDRWRGACTGGTWPMVIP